jgi:hypothetical protein
MVKYSFKFILCETFVFRFFFVRGKLCDQMFGVLCIHYE